MSKQSVNGSTADELSLKFLFSNQDGVSVILRFHKSTLIHDVKSQLMQHWPENVTPTDDVKCIRMICMGRGMLQDPQTLDQSKVPGFQTHPTPVNVSVLRKSSIAVPTTPGLYPLI